MPPAQRASKRTSLVKYREKRDFRRTPEPSGKKAKSATGHSFVVQKHAASRLHYDFRLELDGVLKSWAVPKGPSLDPQTRALAVHVEDHPVEYGKFEGVIPEGEYGGGTVMLWDRGTWEPEGDARRDYDRGKLRFTLHGTKLSGSWTLVRMQGRSSEDGKNWLLIKRRDRAARPSREYDVVEAEPKSVLTGRTMEEIAGSADRVWTRNGEQRRKKRTVNATAMKPAKRPKSTKGSRTAASAAKRQPAARARRGISARWQKQVARLAGAQATRKLVVPTPMLATLEAAAPEGDQWLHEVKFDGYRILAIIEGGRVRLLTRRHLDWTDRLPSLANALAASKLDDIVLDGEAVVMNEKGVSDFQRLQNSMQRLAQDTIVYYAFDLPYAAGTDLQGVSLLERKDALRELLADRFPDNTGAVRYSDHIRGDGPLVLQQTCRMRAEGIISKRADSKYESARTRHWLKIKCLQRQEFVIGGYTAPAGEREGFGSLLLGYYDGSRLKYCGRVGTGFTNESLRMLIKALAKLEAASSPFDRLPPASVRRNVTWVRPELVAEVEFSEWTKDDRLRHPSFQGLREDKPPREVVRERVDPATARKQKPVKIRKPRTATSSDTKSLKTQTSKAKSSNARSRSASIVVAGVTLTNPDREMYSQQGITKRALAEYYLQVAEWILPHVADRPLTLVRCPQGSQHSCFYQKHFKEEMPDALRSVKVQEKKGTGTYVTLNDAAGLVSLVQIGVLEIHPWGSRNDRLDRPDRVIWDLDPGEGSDWADVLEAARAIRGYLEELGLKSYVRTSGGKGLHVVLPIERRNSWDEVKAFARSVAELLMRAAPDKYLITASKAQRRGKIFVDYLRNDYGATAVASYSTRARSRAPIATPLSWDELKQSLRADQYHIGNLLERLRRQGDPWRDFDAQRQRLSRVLIPE